MGMVSFSMDSVNLTCISHIKLLGVTIQNDFKWNLHVDDIVSRASRKLYSLSLLKKARVDQDELLAVFNGYIRPVLEYACQLWHTAITQKQCDQIERVQKRAFHIIFGSMYTSYNNVLSEFNLASLWQRRQNLLHSFGEKLLSSDKFLYLLPPVKNCTRVLRSNAQASLTVPFYNTERYRNSTIPAITKLLNANVGTS